jgi:hypothetical protein
MTTAALPHRLLALAIAVAVTLVTVVVTTATSAQAAPNGYLHMYEDDYYKGGTVGRDSYDANFRNDHMCRSKRTGEWYRTTQGYCSIVNTTAEWYVDDSISSIDNNTSYWWKMFEHRDYGGYTLCVRPWGYDNNLGNNTPVEDDLSSVKRINYDPDKNDQPGGCDKVVG